MSFCMKNDATSIIIWCCEHCSYKIEDITKELVCHTFRKASFCMKNDAASIIIWCCEHCSYKIGKSLRNRYVILFERQVFVWKNDAASIIIWCCEHHSYKIRRSSYKELVCHTFRKASFCMKKMMPRASSYDAVSIIHTKSRSLQRNQYVILFGRQVFGMKKWRCEHHHMMLRASFIQNWKITKELVCHTFRKGEYLYEKMTPRASSYDAASIVHTKSGYYKGISMSYFSEGEFLYEKNDAASIIIWCCEHCSYKIGRSLRNGMSYFFRKASFSMDKKWCRQHHHMMLRASFIQKSGDHKGIGMSYFWKKSFCMKKVMPRAARGDCLRSVRSRCPD
jgi:copper chaperone CopZ